MTVHELAGEGTASECGMERSGMMWLVEWIGNADIWPKSSEKRLAVELSFSLALPTRRPSVHGAAAEDCANILASSGGTSSSSGSILIEPMTSYTNSILPNSSIV